MQQSVAAFTRKFCMQTRCISKPKCKSSKSLFSANIKKIIFIQGYVTSKLWMQRSDF